jgi:hypothetical protein
MLTKTDNNDSPLSRGSRIRALRQRQKRTLDDTAAAGRHFEAVNAAFRATLYQSMAILVVL